MGQQEAGWCDAYLNTIALNHQGRLGLVERYVVLSTGVEFRGRDLSNRNWHATLPIVLADYDREHVAALFEARDERE